MMVAVVIRLFSPKSSPRKVSPLRYDPSLLPFSCFSSLSFSLWEALHNLKMTCRFTFFPASVGLTWVRFSTGSEQTGPCLSLVRSYENSIPSSGTGLVPLCQMCAAEKGDTPAAGVAERKEGG